MGGGYAGRLLDWASEFGSCLLQIVKRSDDMEGFEVLTRRWVVERTLSWLGRYRRLSKDYESLTASSEFMILNTVQMMIQCTQASVKDCEFSKAHG